MHSQEVGTPHFVETSYVCVHCVCNQNHSKLIKIDNLLMLAHWYPQVGYLWLSYVIFNNSKPVKSIRSECYTIGW